MNLYLTNLFSLTVLLSSLLVINSTNPVNSIINLILVFLNSVGLFILLGVDFIGLLYIIVYVGAIAILFLFVVIILNIKQISSVTTKLPLIFPLIIILILGSFLLTISSIPFHGPLTQSQFSNLKATINFFDSKSSIELLGKFLYTTNSYFLLVISLILLVGIIGSIVLANPNQFKSNDTK